MRAVPVDVRSAGVAVVRRGHGNIEGFRVVAQMLHNALRYRHEKQPHRVQLLSGGDWKVPVEMWPFRKECGFDCFCHRVGRVVVFAGSKHNYANGMVCPSAY